MIAKCSRYAALLDLKFKWNTKKFTDDILVKRNTESKVNGCVVYILIVLWENFDLYKIMGMHKSFK